MKDILKKRRSIYYMQALKYLQYVFNEHFILFILIAIGVLAVQYAQFLQRDQLNIIEKIVVVTVVSIISLLIGQLATFVEEADEVFLLVKEKEMKKELQTAVRRSLIFPAFIMIVLITISIPALRFSFYIAVIWLLLLIIIKGILLTFKLRRFFPSGNLDWSSLTRYEANRQARLLKVYAMFTNVKGLTISAKRRKYLDFLLPRRLSSTHSYLYSRTYLRAGDYLGLTLRLLLLTLIGIVFIPSFFTALIFVSILNYLLVFQLLALREVHMHQPLLKIYPTTLSSELSALQRFVLAILGIVVIIETSVLLIVDINQWMYIVIFAAATLFFSLLYINYRLKIKK